MRRFAGAVATATTRLRGLALRSNASCAREAEAEAAAAVQGAAFAVAPGSSLRVALPRVACVEVHTHPSSYEEVCVELPERGAAVSAEGNVVSVTASKSESESAAAVTLLRAWVPERFCSVAIDAPGALVKIEGVREADVRVSGPAQALTLGSVRGGAFSARAVGDVQVRSLSADVDVHTQGGAVRLHRMVGNAVSVHTGGGDVDVDTLYAPRVSIASAGGSITLEHADLRRRGGSSDASADADCESGSVIDSSGGGVTIGGLDGSAALRTGGGALSLRANKGAGAVTVDTADGDAELLVDPEALPCHLETHGEGTLALDEALEVVDGQLRERAKGTERARHEEDGPRHEEDGPRISFRTDGTLKAAPQSWWAAKMGVRWAEPAGGLNRGRGTRGDGAHGM